ncbi:MAG: Aerobic respiration control sensor protein ArcB, partial [Bacteroidota bacterium]
NIDSVHLSALEASLSNTDLTKLLLQLFLFVLIVLIMYAVVQTQQQKLYSLFTEAVNQITLNFTKFCNTNSPPPTHLFSEFDQLYQSITTEFKTVIGDLERQNTAMNFYEYVFDLYPEPILVTDTNSLIQGMNKAFTHVFGYTKADIMGNHISCFTPQEHFRENIQIQESIVASEQIAIENTHRVAKNQKLIKTTIVSKPSKNYDATEYNYLIFKTSTHTQNLTPTNDTKIPDTFKTFFDNAAIGLAVLHFDNPVDWNSGTITPENLTHVLTSLRLLHYNTQTAKLLGISKHTKSLNITDLFPNNHNFIYQRVVQLLEHKQQKFTFYLHRDKKIVWIEINLVCALDQSGFITNIYTDLRDVTDHRTLQKKLRDAKYKAELANQLKSAFLSNMSHEIRTPLTAIVGFNELLNEKDSTEEERLQYTENINQSSYVLLQLIEDIVDISKIEADMLHLDKQQVDVGDMLKKLRQTFSIYLRQANKHHIQFRFEIRDELDNISLISDRLRLEQVLSNLLHNAIKFTETGAIIVGVTISQSANLPSIRFWVRDTGIGISPKDQKIVFQRFTKLNPSLSGTGLGLSISQRLVHLLGGKLEIQSNLGIGTTFSFELPVKSKRQTDKQTEEVTKPQKVTPPTRKLKALVAEDNDLNYLLLYKILKSVGIESERAKNGMEVIHKATGEAVYDLILMDIQMPVMDGIEATSHLREQGIDIPIIAQTAFTLDRDYDRMMKAGCTIIFNKPIKAQELYAVIERTCHINLQY